MLVYFMPMFLYVIFRLELLFTHMKMILMLCDYPCGKDVSDNVYKCKVPDSANGCSQYNAGSSLIFCEALGRPSWNSHFEEQRWHPTFYPQCVHSKSKLFCYWIFYLKLVEDKLVDFAKSCS